MLTRLLLPIRFLLFAVFVLPIAALAILVSLIVVPNSYVNVKYVYLTLPWWWVQNPNWRREMCDSE